MIRVRGHDVPDHHRTYEDLKGELLFQFRSPALVPARKPMFETNGLVLADASSGKCVEESPNAPPLRKSFAPSRPFVSAALFRRCYLGAVKRIFFRVNLKFMLERMGKQTQPKRLRRNGTMTHGHLTVVPVIREA